MGCGNSKSSSMSNNKVHGHSSTSTTKYGYSSSTTQAYDPSITTTKTKGSASFKGDEYYVHKPRVMYYSEEQNDDTFNEYIQRAGQKIRTGGSKIIDPEFISNTSSSPTTTTEQDVANTNYCHYDKEKENDQQFSDFIQIAKKKLRTTSRVGRNNGSFKRGQAKDIFVQDIII